MNENLQALFILNRLPGFGISAFKKEAEAGRGPAALLQALKQGGNPVWRDEIQRMLEDREPEKEFDRCAEKGINIFGFGLPGYPENLYQIHDPPLILYSTGSLPQQTPCFSIVGTRHPSPYGLAAARKFSVFLAEAGITIVSGFARGIDSEAHRGALQAGGGTVAVLGCGLDVIYPAENRALYDEIREKGALVSEHPPGTPPLAPHFPKRNRLISGLSLGVLVVEANEKSGSLITASLALEQGKEVFAIPGRIDSVRSLGTNRLIRQGGAFLADSPESLLCELGPVLKNYFGKKGAPAPGNGLFDSEDPILSALASSSLSLAELSGKTGLEAEKAAAGLTLLEIKRLVLRQADGRYALAGKAPSQDKML